MPTAYDIAIANRVEEIAQKMRWLDGHSEDLWQEVERMLTSHDADDMHDVETMTLVDIIEIAAEKRAKHKIEAAAVERERVRISQY